MVIKGRPPLAKLLILVHLKLTEVAPQFSFVHFDLVVFVIPKGTSLNPNSFLEA